MPRDVLAEGTSGASDGLRALAEAAGDARGALPRSCGNLGSLCSLHVAWCSQHPRRPNLPVLEGGLSLCLIFVEGLLILIVIIIL